MNRSASCCSPTSRSRTRRSSGSASTRVGSASRATSFASPDDAGTPAAARTFMRRAACLLVISLLFAPGSSAHSISARPIAVVAAHQSFNWAGYVQGALEKNKTFHSITATWIVPTATPHRPGEAEYSSSWIGIGGGCVDAACSITDATLIQAGIGHDIDAAGNADYYAWWETIPAPLVRTTLPVRAGDRVVIAIFEGR